MELFERISQICLISIVNYFQTKKKIQTKQLSINFHERNQYCNWPLNRTITKSIQYCDKEMHFDLIPTKS